jgi:hypothetical protein
MAANFTRLNLASYANDTWTTLKTPAGAAYSVGADTATTVSSLHITNNSGGAITMGLKILDGGDNLVHHITPEGLSVDVASFRANGEFNLVTGDKIQVKFSVAGCSIFANIVEE